MMIRKVYKGGGGSINMKTKEIKLNKIIDEMNERNKKVESQKGREAEVLIEEILNEKNKM